MSNVLITAAGPMTSVSPLGMDFGVQEQLVTARFPLYTPYIGGTGTTNTASVNTAASGTISGSPTESGTGFQINTGGTDYVTTSLNDYGAGYLSAPDFTIFVVVAPVGTPAWYAISTYGPDAGNGANTSAKGIWLIASSSTVVQFRDFHSVSGTVSGQTLPLTVPDLATAAKCFCIQRSTVGSNVYRSIFNMTNGTSTIAPADPNPAANNMGLPFLIGATKGGNGGPCNIPFVQFFQSPQGGGGALSSAQIGQVYPRIKTQMANIGIAA